MYSDTDPYAREEFYNKYLKEISGIRFTLREIDVIACIIYNKGEKKAASILSISHKTVGTHVRNIMGKLGVNSQGSIVDAIDRSGKRQYINKHYLPLLTESVFIKYLHKISALINRTGASCFIDTDSSSAREDKLLSQIRIHLEATNILLTTVKDDPGLQYYIRILYETPSTKSKNHIDGNRPQVINVVLNKAIKPLLSDNMEYIDFSPEADYYLSLLALIDTVISKPELRKIVEAFQSEYKAIQLSWAGDHMQGFQKTNSTLPPEFKLPYKLIAFIFVLFFIASVSIGYRLKNKPDIRKINAELAWFVKEFSADNITSLEQKQKNYSLIGRVEKTISAIVNNKEASCYFSTRDIPAEELLNCLYSLHAISNQYTYNENNGRKARRLLKYAKHLAEQYVMSKTGTRIDFNTLSLKEIYVELSIVKDLPQMYARIMFLLGRTYLYQADPADRKDCVRYFRIAQYLGERLGIFEGYMSIIAGFEVIRRKQIDAYIKSGDFINAREQLNKAIELFQNLQNNNRKYTMNYKPGNVNPEEILPAKSILDLILRKTQMAMLYSKLIMITDNIGEQSVYMDQISSLFIGNNDTAGILDLLGTVTFKKVALVYNNLGNILLKLYDKEINFKYFKNAIVNKLSLEMGPDLTVIEQIFNLAESISRYTDYTKADAYDGIIRVYRKMLANDDLGAETIDKLKTSIKVLKSKRDNINHRLYRENEEY